MALTASPWVEVNVEQELGLQNEAAYAIEAFGMAESPNAAKHAALKFLAQVCDRSINNWATGHGLGQRLPVR